MTDTATARMLAVPQICDERAYIAIANVHVPTNEGDVGHRNRVFCGSRRCRTNFGPAHTRAPCIEPAPVSHGVWSDPLKVVGAACARGYWGHCGRSDADAGRGEQTKNEARKAKDE
jgi:hypothetical protein